jgi:hypothetical protein
VNRHSRYFGPAKIYGAVHLQQMVDCLSPLGAIEDLRANAFPRLAGKVHLIGEMTGDSRRIEPDERRAIRREECPDVRRYLARAHSRPPDNTRLDMTFSAEFRSNEPVPAGVGSLQLGSRPAPDVGESKRHAGRPAHAGIAVHYYSLGAGPFLNEGFDCARVVRGEENIRRLAALDDVIEMQPEHSGEATGDARRLSIRVGNGNANLPFPGLVTLGLLPGEDDKLRDQSNHTNHIITIAS